MSGASARRQTSWVVGSAPALASWRIDVVPCVATGWDYVRDKEFNIFSGEVPSSVYLPRGLDKGSARCVGLRARTVLHGERSLCYGDHGRPGMVMPGHRAVRRIGDPVG